MRQLLGALFGCGWTVDDVVDLSFEQIREVAKCVYAHKQQMIASVLDPIAEGLSKGGKGGKRRRRNYTQRGSTKTQKELRESGLSAAERDNILMSRLKQMGFNT